MGQAYITTEFQGLRLSASPSGDEADEWKITIYNSKDEIVAVVDAAPSPTDGFDLTYNLITDGYITESDC